MFDFTLLLLRLKRLSKTQQGFDRAGEEEEEERGRRAEGRRAMGEREGMRRGEDREETNGERR